MRGDGAEEEALLALKRTFQEERSTTTPVSLFNPIVHGTQFTNVLYIGDQESDPDYPPPPPPEPENDANIRYRPMAPFSWRNEICRFLDVSPDALDDEVFQAMTKASIILKEAEQMKAKYEAGRGPPRYEIIHSVRCEQSRTEGRLYLDQPWVVETGPNDAHLRGSQPILNFELFLERNKEIVFVIYKDYRCCGRQHNSRSRAHTEPDGQVDASSLLTAEHISIISPDLSSAMEEFSDIALGDFPHTDFRGGEEMRHPYIWWFHRRKEIDEALEKYKSSPWLPMVYLFREYILGRMTEEWETVDGLLARKRICLKYMDYLFASFLIVNCQRDANATTRFLINLLYQQSKDAIFQNFRVPSHKVGSNDDPFWTIQQKSM